MSNYRQLSNQTLSSSNSCPSCIGFRSTWRTTTSTEEIRIGIDESESYNCTVYWGDGNNSTISFSAPHSNAYISHTYASSGDYEITIEGNFPRINMGRGYGTPQADAHKIISINRWGTQQWSTMENAFKGCVNLSTYTASDTPDLSSCQSLREMFFLAPNFDGYIGDWDVSNVTNMYGMFSFANSFDQNISNWDVSNVTNMSRMFLNTFSFNQNINDWDVSNVTNMQYMFQGSTTFSKPLNNWDVSNVTDMSYMFFNANDFNQNINDWDVSNVTNMGGMFYIANDFNQPLNNWDVSNVTNMQDMFRTAGLFNQNLSSWNVSNVTSCNNFSFNASSWTLQKPSFNNCTP